MNFRLHQYWSITEKAAPRLICQNELCQGPVPRRQRREDRRRAEGGGDHLPGQRLPQPGRAGAVHRQEYGDGQTPPRPQAGGQARLGRRRAAPAGPAPADEGPGRSGGGVGRQAGVTPPGRSGTDPAAPRPPDHCP